MQLTFDIPDKELLELGKETIHLEFQKMFKWIKIKQSFKKISMNLKEIDESSYYRELEKIREISWDDYKKGIEI